MTVSYDHNNTQFMHPADSQDTRLQIVEGEMYDVDNRLVYLEDQLEGIQELLNHLHELMCPDVAGNEHLTQVDVTPQVIDMSLNQQ